MCSHKLKKKLVLNQIYLQQIHLFFPVAKQKGQTIFNVH